MKGIPDNYFDAIITDPPYNVNYKYNTYRDNLSDDDYFKSQIQFLRECERILKENGQLAYLNYPEFNSRIFVALEEDFEMKPYEIMAWVYPTNLGGKFLRKGFRTWIFATKGKPYCKIQGEYQNPKDNRIKKLVMKGMKPKSVDWVKMNQVKNVSKEKTKHPCQIPEDLMTSIILGLSKHQDLILDPFMGSGTTGSACIKAGRSFVGIEIDKEYIKIAETRIKAVQDNLL